MIKNFTNGNSRVYLRSFIKEANSNNYVETSSEQYTKLSSTNKIKITLNNFEFRSEQDINSALIACFFKQLGSGLKFALTDAKGSTIDVFTTGESLGSINSSTENYINFDITSFIKRCVKQKKVEDLYLTLLSNQTLDFVGFNYINKENDSKDGSEKIEYLHINYVNLKGMDSSFEYLTSDLGTVGKSQVNLKSGNMFYSLPLLANGKNNEGILACLFYNSLFKGASKNTGRGWLTSFDFSVDMSEKDSNQTIKFTDYTRKETYLRLLSDSERSKLIPETKGNKVYYSYADGNFIVEEKSGNFAYVTKDGCRMYFTVVGTTVQIKKYVFENGHEIVAEYKSGRISKLTFSDGGEMTFKYKNEQLIQIYDSKYDLYAKLIYNGLDLVGVETQKITYDILKDGKKKINHLRRVDLRYSLDGLIAVENVKEGLCQSYIYEQERVVNVANSRIKAKEKINGLSYQIAYGDDFTKVTNSAGKSVYYSFDNYGSCNYTLSDDGVSKNYKYGTVNDYDIKKECHKIKGKMETQSNMPNLLFNGSFEFANSPLYGWEHDNHDKSKVVVGLSQEGLYGNTCLEVQALKKEPFTFKQTVFVQKQGLLKMFGFYKSTSGSDAVARVEAEITYKEEIPSANDGYYYSVSSEKADVVTRTKTIVKELKGTKGQWKEFVLEDLNLPKDSVIEVKVITLGEETVWFDEMQLTQNNFLGAQNFVRNSHFELSENGAPTSWKMTNCSGGDGIVPAQSSTEDTLSSLLQGNVFRFKNDEHMTEKSIEQEIMIAGEAGDNIVVNGWFKSELTKNELCRLEVEVSHKNTKNSKVRSYYFDVPTSIKGWQVLTNSIVMEYPYDKITLRVVYKGFHDVCLDAIQLFKCTTGSSYSYDEKGNMMAAANSERSVESSYDKNNKLKTKSCVDGETFKYDYDEKGRLIGIQDNFGNNVAIQYGENSVIKEIKSNGKIIRTEEKAEANGTIVKTDMLGHVTYSRSDEYGNAVNYIDAKNTVVRKMFDVSQRLIEVERYDDEASLGICEFLYNDMGKLTEILCANGSVVQFEYDDWGRCISANVNGNKLFDSKYAPKDQSEQDLVVENTVNSDYGCVRKFKYDSNGNVTAIFEDGVAIFTLKYDDLSRLVEFKDETTGKCHYYNYDLSNNLISETDTLGFGIYYDYDNIGNVQKEIVDIEDKQIGFDYIHPYEFNENDRDSFVGRLDRTYQDDIVVGDNGINGLYGMKSDYTATRYAFDEEIKMNTSELAYAGKCLNYNLASVNSSRQSSLSNGGTFNKYLWKLNFDKSKTVWGWIKLLGEIQQKTLFRFCGHGNDVELSAIDENRLCLRVNSTAKEIVLRDSILGKWIMPTLRVFNDAGNTKVTLYLQDIFIHMMTVEGEIANELTSLQVGDYQTAEGVDTAYLAASKTPIRIAMLSVGGYFYKTVNIKTIHALSKQFLFANLEQHSYSGVSTALLEECKDFVSLNGSFVSLKRVKPTSTTYNDGSFKVDKSRSFEFDEQLRRHVYSCYEGVLKLSDSNSARLTYDFNLDKQFNIMLSFNPKLESTSAEGDRTIIAFNDSTSEKLSIFLNKDSELCYRAGDEIKTLITTPIALDTWHELKLAKKDSSIVVSIDGATKTIRKTIDLTKALVNVGCSVRLENQVEVAYAQLNGCIADICIASKEIVSSPNYSFLEKQDAMGRKVEDTFIVDDVKYKKEYGYLSPMENGKKVLNRTSTLVETETDTLGNQTTYKYDETNNVIEKKVKRGDKVTSVSYKYDKFERLIFSNDSLAEKSTDYTYDTNGNIESITKREKGYLTSHNFVYDAANAERLSRVEIQGKTNNTIELVYPNEQTLYPNVVGDISLKWKGNNATEIARGDLAIKFTYDIQNRIVRKQSDKDDIKFVYDRSKLVAEVGLNHKTVYIYDERNRIVGFVLTQGGVSKVYYYVKDNLGVITSILDASGTVVCEYEYDDFGYPTNVTGNILNNIIYKGYYYDADLEWYYLKSRFYMPQLCRFLSPDDSSNLMATVNDLLQFNLFAYCDNNPIMRRDETGGNWFKDAWNSIKKGLKKVVEVVVTVVVAAVGAVVGATLGAASAAITSIAKGNDIETVISDTFDGGRDGCLIGLKAGKYVGQLAAGSLFGDEEMLNRADEILNNELKPAALSFAQENLIGLVALADTLNLLLMVTPIGLPYSIAHDVIAEKNYQHNIEILGENDENIISSTINGDGSKNPDKNFAIAIDDEVYVNDQNATFFETVLFGDDILSDNGCSVLATYNMLRRINKGISLSKLIYYFEYENFLFGRLGAWPTHIAKLFAMLGVRFKMTVNENDITEFSAEKAQAYMFTYFNSFTGFGLHTTFIPKVNSYLRTKTDASKIGKYFEVNGYGGEKDSIDQYFYTTDSKTNEKKLTKKPLAIFMFE